MRSKSSNQQIKRQPSKQATATKRRLPLTEYKLRQKAAIDALRRAGG